MFHTTIELETHGEGEIIDLTFQVQQAITESAVRMGLVTVFVTGSTAAVTTIEYEPGVLSDLSRALAVIAPDDIPYAHDAAWGDGNGRSHVRAAIVGPSLSIPVIGGRLDMFGSNARLGEGELLVAEETVRSEEVSLADLDGQFSLPEKDSAGSDAAAERWLRLANQGRGTAIAGGSTFIQRNIVAERILGMPRE